MDDVDVPDFKASFLEAIQLLAKVGAERREDGWYWPFYQHNAPTIMLETSAWLAARKTAARVLDEILDERFEQDIMQGLGRAMPRGGGKDD